MRIRRIVDLTHVVSPDIQVYPGDPAPVFTTHASVETDGFDLTHIHMGSQTGTHIDAPRHVRRDGAPVDVLPPGGLVARGVVFDVREYVDDASFVTPDMLRHEHVPAPGDIAILHTGWARYFGTARYFDHPVLSVDACHWLLERGVRVVGIDAPSIDATGDETLAAHHVLAVAGAVICENLCNLEEIDFPDPLISLLPIPFAGVDGSPVRAVAIDIET